MGMRTKLLRVVHEFFLLRPEEDRIGNQTAESETTSQKPLGNPNRKPYFLESETGRHESETGEHPRIRNQLEPNRKPVARIGNQQGVTWKPGRE